MCVKGTLSRFQLLLLSGSHKPNSRVFLLCCAALEVFSRSPGAFPRMATGQPAAGHSFAGLSAIDKLW